MLEITGTHNTAKVFIDTIDETAREQIRTMCSQDYLADSRIRIMPDTHAGKGCTIGTLSLIHISATFRFRRRRRPPAPGR